MCIRDRAGRRGTALLHGDAIAEFYVFSSHTWLASGTPYPQPLAPSRGPGEWDAEWTDSRIFAVFRAHCRGARWAGDAALTARLAGCLRPRHRVGLCLSVRCPWREVRMDYRGSAGGRAAAVHFAVLGGRSGRAAIWGRLVLGEQRAPNVPLFSILSSLTCAARQKGLHYTQSGRRGRLKRLRPPVPYGKGAEPP